MKKLYDRISKKTLFLTICTLVALIVVLNGAGWFLKVSYISLPAAVEEGNTFEIRSRLLMEAMGYVGVSEPKQAVEVWAQGLQKRSAAMQYSVMGAELKKIYASQLEDTAPNWVTGVSSPWVSGYTVDSSNRADADTIVYNLTVATQTSSGPAGSYKAELTVKKIGSFWQIVKVSTDKQLNVYTGFKAGA